MRLGVLWISDTVVASWWDRVHEGVMTSLGHIHSVLPRFFDSALDWLSGTAWPWFAYAFGEPVLWLAVAALVFGTRVMSFAEMWRKGEPLSAHLDADHHLVIDKKGRRRRAAGTRGRRVAIEIQEAFFGDLDDKYLPTFQSLRLILGGGLLFLSAYVMVYSITSLTAEEFRNTIFEIIGGKAAQFYIAWGEMIGVITIPLGETLRFATLTVAFQQALRVFRENADPSTVRPEHRHQVGSTQTAETPQPTGVSR